MCIDLRSATKFISLPKPSSAPCYHCIKMTIYLSILAGCSTLTAPFSKGSRDYLRLRGLDHLATKSSSPSLLVDPQAVSPWRDYDLERYASTEGEAVGWRDYNTSVDNHPAQSNYSPIRRPAHFQLEHTRPLSAGHSYSSSTPFSVHDQQPTVLEALIAENRKLKECDRKNLAARPFPSIPGKVEQATRESWAKSGLRISPFRLQGLGRQ
ncbi:hypothetical protein DFH07DRAFT_238384 [Mycena maculata]|uniref:Uncharacterized protein n=1 Tax=Mycena maculata TaxID=230809 RepID=A0AAD7NQ38_9AGAR|nr:hypothetical protein DFH07DRAFT_238384 [Mycena maculata]